MKRNLLEEHKLSPEAKEAISHFHLETVTEVAKAAAENQVLVVGMAQNVFVKRVKKALTEAQVKFTYLEYGSYLSQWQKRLAIKLWSGWPTFPQVFVNGVLIGGFDDTKKRLDEKRLLETAATNKTASKQH